MKRPQTILSLTLTLLLLAACAPPTPIPTPPPTPVPTATPAPVAFSTFLQEVSDSRKAILTAEDPPDASPWMLDFPDQLDTFTEAELDALLTSHPAESDFTYQDAKEDVETFFHLLKTTYGAYDYFGGDAVFLPLRDQVLAQVESAPGPFPRTVEEALMDALAPVLLDGHFSIGSDRPANRFRTEMYYVPDVYVTDPAQAGPASAPYLKPTIAPDGSIQFWYAALSHDGSDLPQSLDGRTLRWTQAERVPRSYGDKIFEETETDGIPTLVSRQMFADNPEQQAQLDRFAACGGEYAEEPLLILDVRANGGGMDNYIMGWFEGFAGRPADRRGAGGHKYSPLAVRASDYYAQFPERLGRWMSWSGPGTWTENDGTVFVLTDKGTASSGETVVEFLRTVEGTLFVGGPTAGCALVSSNFHFYLPHSGLDIYFGTGLCFSETLENRDGVGYLPDLWVNPPDAPSAVARLRDYYQLP